MGVYQFLVLGLLASVFVSVASADCSLGQCKLLDKCSKDEDCGAGLYCGSCMQDFEGSKCIRSNIADQFTLVNNTLPFNKYAFLTTHNAFAICNEPDSFPLPRLTFCNQEDTITSQLNSGVRGFMLDTYDFKGDIWLCHAPEGECTEIFAFEPLSKTLIEFEAFLSANPTEIVILILEDYVETPNGLTKVFTDAGLMKYWFPVANMPKNGEDWPLVKDMVANNHRLLVFTSKAAKEASEGIAYQWRYMAENQYGNGGMKNGECQNRGESPQLNDRSVSLVLVNYFRSVPLKVLSCDDNSDSLINMLNTCQGASGNRWANFVAVDFYKKSAGGGAFQAVDTLNGKLICGCDDVHACVNGSTSEHAMHKPSSNKKNLQN